MSSSSSAIFNGNSRYSQDFQSVIDRTVAIASLPINQLTNDKSNLTDQTTAVKGLQSVFNNLATTLKNVGSATGLSSYQSAVSDSSLVSATLSDGVLEGTYSVEVQDIGAYASSMSKSAWSAASSARTYQLVVGNSTIDITADSDDVTAVAAKINEQAGDKVRATVVNVGGAQADYRLVLQSVRLGDLTPELLSGGVDAQHEQAQGRVAKYAVNGSGTVVESDTRTINIATGLSLDLTAADPDSPVEISVTRSTAALSSALSAFASAFNAATAQVEQQRGTSGGALGGQSIVFDLSNSLRSLATWSDSGSDLQSLGLTLDRDGKLTFDASQLASTAQNGIAGISQLLGSSTKSGFLKFATDALGAVTDSDNGELQSALASMQSQIQSVTDNISAQQERVDAMKESLQARMAAADALIASMEQQYTYLSTMFASMQTASQQYK